MFKLEGTRKETDDRRTKEGVTVLMDPVARNNVTTQRPRRLNEIL